MATWNYSTITVSDMKSKFPVKELEPIPGRPNLYELLKAFKMLCRCSKTTNSGLGPLGYLFVALTPVHYGAYKSTPYAPPIPTLELPPIRANMTPTEREHTKFAWQAHKAENENIANMNEALLTMFLAEIQLAYIKSTERDLIGQVSKKF